jgi:hypothetical protein
MKKNKVVTAKVKKVHKDIDKKQKKKKVKPDPKPKPKYVVLLKNPSIAKVLHALALGYVIRRRLLEGDFEYISLANQFLSCESPVNGQLKWDIHTIDFSLSDYWEVLFPIGTTGVELV